MKKVFGAIAMLGLTSAVVAQGNLVPWPAHANVYDGFSRGFRFDAQTNFTITALELPPEAMQAGDTASFSVWVNNVEVLRDVGGASAQIATSIAVASGDRVDIIGNWSPASPGNFSAHNSYTSSFAAATPYTADIEGVSHTFFRSGIQWDVGDVAGSAGLVPFTVTSGQMGRIFMYTVPAPGALALLGLGGLVATRRRR